LLALILALAAPAFAPAAGAAGGAPVLAPAAGRTSSVRDGNAAGQVVGTAETGAGNLRAVSWSSGATTGLGTLGGARPA
jgi:probable HAF family extracellular repeat protein